jgi:glycosyltransferase involved in cell wall biosynthesis
VPLVSVLLAAHNDGRFLGAGVDSVFHQTARDLELIVVDDASTDETPELLSRITDRRFVLLRNDEQLGLARSLNRALDQAKGRYVARLDADDIALPQRLERQLARIRATPPVGIVGSSVVDLTTDGRQGRTHVMPAGSRPLRWHALFSSPFFHPTVLVDRHLLDDHGLRYDPSFLESEDYDLWTRLFAFSDGDNLRDAFVLKRVHAGQASQHRGELQESFQRQVALREINRVAPDVDAELAWLVGARKRPRRGARKAFLRLLAAFERQHGRDGAVRMAALRALARAGLSRR